MIWLSHASVGSEPSVGSAGSMAPRRPVAGSAVGGCSAAAIFSMSGRYASRVARVHGVTVTERPVVDVDRPVAWATWRSATRASCS